ncbi:MAG: IPT/TIG domain-containing protein, partial [Chloroflexi bacterium]|nr:IPT/TIG domain-containing protein [Chloroflexota bacterium]
MVRAKVRSRILAYILLIAFLMGAVPFPAVFGAAAYAQGAEQAPAGPKLSTALVSTADNTGIKAAVTEADKAILKAFEESPRFTVADPADVNPIITEMGLKPPLTLERAVEVGQRLHTDTVLMAKVLKLTKLEDPVRYKAEIVLNLVDTSTGYILSKSQMTGTSSAESMVKANDSLLMSEAFQMAARFATKEILDNLSLTGAVISVKDDNKIVIDKGAIEGLNDGAEIIVTRDGRPIAAGHVTKLSDIGNSDVVITDLHPDTIINTTDRFQVVFNPTPERLARMLKEAGKAAPGGTGMSAGFVALLAGLALAAIGKNEGDQAAQNPDEAQHRTFTHVYTVNGTLYYQYRFQLVDAHNNPVQNQPVRFTPSYGLPRVQDVPTDGTGYVTANFSITYDEWVGNGYAYPTIHVVAGQMTDDATYTGDNWLILSSDKQFLNSNHTDRATLTVQVVDKNNQPIVNERVILSLQAPGAGQAFSGATLVDASNSPLPTYDTGGAYTNTTSHQTYEVFTNASGLATAYLLSPPVPPTGNQLKVDVVEAVSESKIAAPATRSDFYLQGTNNISYQDSPVITLLTPNSGSPGTVVTIDGLNFGSSVGSGANQVLFNGIDATSGVINWGTGRIVVFAPTPPAGQTITGLVHVIRDGIQSNGVMFNSPAPVIQEIYRYSTQAGYVGDHGRPGIDPNAWSVWAAHPYSYIHVIGQGFGPSQGTGSLVAFQGGVNAPLATLWTETQIIVKVPAGAISGPVYVNRAGIASNGQNLPIATSFQSFTPANGSMGTLITINGAGFGSTQGTRFGLGLTVAQIASNPEYFVSWTDTQLIVKVPGGATSGILRAYRSDPPIYNPVGDDYAEPESIFNINVPTITSLSPSAGYANTGVPGSGTQVAVAGTNFGAAYGTGNFTGSNIWGQLYYYNSLGSSVAMTTNYIKAWSDTSITFETPSDIETGNIFVRNQGGDSNGMFFTVYPTIASVSPPDMPADAGLNAETENITRVTITGNHFGSTQASGSTVTFGNTNIGSALTWTNTIIVTHVPLGTTGGNVSVTVSVADTPSNAKPYNVGTTIYSFTPASVINGGRITVNGYNFGTTAGSALGFAGDGAAPAWAISIITWNNDQIVASLPASAISGRIRVINPNLSFIGPALSADLLQIPAPELTQITPLNGAYGDLITLTGNNFGNVRGTVIFCGNIEVGGNDPRIRHWTNGAIVVEVPSGAESGDVQVLTGGGFSNGVFFAINSSITGITPQYQWADSGRETLPTSVPSRVTITGSHFGNTQGSGSRVLFADDFGAVVDAGVALSWVDNQIVVNVPSGAVDGNVIVVVGGTTYSNGILYKVGATITGVLPVEGASGYRVTINGYNFGTSQGTGRLHFTSATGAADGAWAASVTSWTANQIIAEVPGTAATGYITVASADTTRGGNAVSGQKFTMFAPAITELSPANGSIGDRLTITGTHFGQFQGTMSFVTFCGQTVATNYSHWTDSLIVVEVPAGAQTGDVVVRTSGGVSNGMLFAINSSITGVTPQYQWADSGRETLPTSVPSQVTITGSNFGTSQGSGSAVNFNGVNGPVDAGVALSWSENQIVVNVPSGAIDGNVVVIIGGTAYSNGILYNVGATITGFTPVEGASGYRVTINGYNFGNSQGTGRLYLTSATGAADGAWAASVTSWTANQIIAEVPGTAATGYLTVASADTTRGGNAVSGQKFTMFAPEITGENPFSGVAGSRLTIAGSHFGNFRGTMSFVTFCGQIVATEYEHWTDEMIVVVVPDGAQTGDVIIRTSGGVSNGILFVIESAITSISPPFQPADGGFGGLDTAVTIIGSNFGSAQGSGSIITFNTIPAPVASSWTDTVIVVNVPYGATDGSVNIIIGGTASSSYALYQVGATITGIAPTSGPNGTLVTITGQNFGSTLGTLVEFTESTTSTAWAQTIISWTDDQVIAVVPTTAVYGRIKVLSDKQRTDPAASITRYCGKAVSGDKFTITGPTLTSILPISGVYGTRVTLTGTDFGSAQGTTGKVIFCGTTEAVVTHWTNNSIVAIVPDGVESGDVIVQTSGGTTVGQPFTILASITDITPQNLPAAGQFGTPVTITGSHFGPTQGSSSVLFFDGTGVALNAGNAISWADGQIVVYVPFGARTGNVVVAVADSTGTLINSNTFYYTVGTTVTTWEPLTG